jgi:hypothetical protein
VHSSTEVSHSRFCVQLLLPATQYTQYIQQYTHRTDIKPFLITFCFICLSSKKNEVSIPEHDLASTLAQTASSGQLLAVQSGQIKLPFTLWRAKEVEDQTNVSTFLSLCLRYCSLQLLPRLFTASPADEANKQRPRTHNLHCTHTKWQVVPVHVTQAYTDSRGTAPLIPGWTSVVSFTFRPHYRHLNSPALR